MYTFSNMNSVSIESIHSAFLDAFSDYEVKIEMPIQKLADMLKTRSYCPEYSIGCFDGDSLIGFCLTGFRKNGSVRCCYDICTGIRNEHRNRKVGRQLVEILIRLMKSCGTDQFQLEVLQNNLAAQKIYTNAGLQITRSLRCYEIEDISSDIDIGPYRFTSEPAALNDIDETEYCSFRPSWQNSLASYHNSSENYRVIALIQNMKTQAYAIVHNRNGNIMQIGVAASARDMQYERILLRKIDTTFQNGKYTLLNIEQGSYMDEALMSAGYKNYVNQFEMLLELQ